MGMSGRGAKANQCQILKCLCFLNLILTEIFANIVQRTFFPKPLENNLLVCNTLVGISYKDILYTATI